MLESIIKTLNLVSGDDVVVFINNLGGTSQLEQWLVAGEVHKQLCEYDIIQHNIMKEFKQFTINESMKT